MNKSFKVLVTSLCCLFGLTLTGCQASDSPSISDGSSLTSSVTSTTSGLQVTEFDVDETKVDSADVGSEYTVKKVVVKASDGKYYQTTVIVKDPLGADVSVTDNKFTCDVIGEYTITYTVSLGDATPISKSYKLNVIDVSEPEIVTTLSENNITMLGSTFDISTITVTDNSKQSITPEISVSFNGESILPTDNIVTFDSKGTYTISAKAADSSDNAVQQDFNVYTVMDNESGKYYNNEWYPTEISDAFAKTGTHSYKFGMFSKASQWFNDYSMLGDVKLLNCDSAKYVSFWMYCDSKAVGLDNVSLVQNARYNKQKVYDVYGNEVALDWQGKIDLVHNNWYRFVISMTEFEMAGEIQDHADADTQPITESLNSFCCYFNSWDNDAGSNSSKAVDVYLDDVRLLGDEDDEVYDVKPVEPYTLPDNCVADFETEDQIENVVTDSWQSTITYNTETTYNNSKGAVSFKPAIEWSSFGFSDKSLTINSLQGYDKVTSKVYIKDTSDSNVYSDTTNLTIDVKFDKEGSVIYSKTVAKANEWFDLEIPVGDYQDKKMSDMIMVVYKKIDGTTIGLGKTIEYNDKVNVLLDDIYVTANNVTPDQVSYDAAYEDIFAKQLDGLTLDNTLGKSSFYCGTFSEQNSLKLINSSPYQLGLESGKNSESGDTFGEGWRFFYGASGAFGYRFVASSHCYVKAVEQKDGDTYLTAGWIEGKLQYGIQKTDETVTTLHDDWLSGAGSLGTDFIELQQGESFLYQFSHSEERNIQQPPYLVITNTVA